METKLPISIIPNTDVQVTQLGMGGAPLQDKWGTTREDALGALRTAYDGGVRYFDTAPFYGSGSSEIYNGEFLSSISRNSFVLSSKVGRLIQPDKTATFNYSREDVLKSIEESLTRLNLDSIDILFIHDPDDHYEEALTQAYPTIAELKSQGVIKAIGVGMNQWEMLAKFAKEADFDCFLLAGRYTLLDHSALDEFMPLCLEKNIGVIIGGPYNSGVLASDLKTETTYFYEPAPDDIVTKTRAIKEICERYQVPLKAVALQFGLKHPAVISTIPGPRNS
ncbi:MAG: pyridoxal 4-dehydrogenase, partial [Chloroflexi bacterium]|nr:pyridoxal 4-dehydrogenase [Chloroflexota bacterium]